MLAITWVGAHPNNFRQGRSGTRIDRIVLHWIVGTLKSAGVTFANPNRNASATYGVGNGEVHQYVKEEDTAFANSNWGMNLRAISIEHEGGPNIPITDATYETSAQLVADIAKRLGIPLDRTHILGHREVSDAKTQCPGTLDIDRIVNRAKAINTPQPEGGDLSLDESKQLEDRIGFLERSLADTRKSEQDNIQAKVRLEQENAELKKKIIDLNAQMASMKQEDADAGLKELQAEKECQEWKAKYEELVKDKETTVGLLEEQCEAKLNTKDEEIVDLTNKLRAKKSIERFSVIELIKELLKRVRG